MHRVLVVEDEDIIRKGLMFMMDWTRVDCTVVGEAADGAEGLDKIRELRPDIVVTDIRMPVKNGLEMLQEARGEASFCAILLSGYDDFEYAREGIRLGVEEYLLKPVDFDELAECIERIRRKLSLLRTVENEAARSALHQLLSEDLFTQPTARYPIGAVLEDVKAQYGTRLSLQELGRKYHISPSYLNTQFKRATGHTFNDFLNRYRILKANELLQSQPALKVYEIAEKVGFSDYKYFIQVFKKYIGYPPLQAQKHLL